MTSLTFNSFDLSKLLHNPFKFQGPRAISTLDKQVSMIIQQELTPLTNEDSKTLQNAFSAAHNWIWSTEKLRKTLSNIPPELLESFFIEQMKKLKEEEIAIYLNDCLSILNEEGLLSLAGFANIEAVTTAYNIYAETKETALRNGIAKEGQAIAKEFAVELKYFFHKLMEILITAIGLNEITRQKHTKYTEKKETLNSEDAHYKLETYWRLIALPASLFAMIYSYVHYRTPAALLTFVSTMSAISALVAYNRYWKPCPIDQHGLKNLSVELLRETTPTYPRRAILTKIKEAFESGKGVILVGDPGTGKSWIVRSFVEEAIAGRICKFIPTPQIFSCNAAALGNPDVLVNIEDRFRRFKSQVVFFLDEFHALFKQLQGVPNNSGEVLKTFHDEFKYIIGATTTDEYKEHIADKIAIIGRRFNIIKVGPMSNEEIQVALTHYLAHAAPKIVYEPAVIDFIIEKATLFNPKTSKIDAAHSLLQSAIQKMSQFENPKLSRKKSDLEADIEKLTQYLIMRQRQHNTTNDDQKEFQKTLSDLKSKKESLKSINRTSETRNQEIHRMQRIESIILKLRKQNYNDAKSDCDLNKDTSRLCNWLRHHTRVNILERLVASEREKLTLPGSLDLTLIETIISEKQKTESETHRTYGL